MLMRSYMRCETPCAAHGGTEACEPSDACDRAVPCFGGAVGQHRGEMRRGGGALLRRLGGGRAAHSERPLAPRSAAAAVHLAASRAITRGVDTEGGEGGRGKGGAGEPRCDPTVKGAGRGDKARGVHSWRPCTRGLGWEGASASPPRYANVKLSEFPEA
jgi:hypothetical protein